MNKFLRISILALFFAALAAFSSDAQADKKLKSRYNLKHVEFVFEVFRKFARRIFVFLI